MGDHKTDTFRLLKNMDIRYKAVFVSTLLWGGLAHGFIFFNKISVQDDLFCLFDVGATYTSGRWFLGTLGSLVSWFFGSPNFSTPLFSGLFSLMCIAAFGCILVKLLDFRRIVCCIALSGILVTFPSVTGLFFYLFTMPYYMVALVLAGLGGLMICRQTKYSVPIGIVLTACSLGIYQAYLPVTLCIFLLNFLHTVHTAEHWSWTRLIRQVLFYAVSSLLCFAVYYGVCKCYLLYYHDELSGYQNISSMGQEGLGVYLNRAILAYKLTLKPTNAKYLRASAYMYPYRAITIYRVLLVVSAILSVWMLISEYRKNRCKAVSTGLALLALPAAANFIYIMCDAGNVHNLMVYGQVMLFVYTLWLAEQIFPFKIHLTQKACQGILLLLLVLSVMDARFANAVYLKAQMEQQQTISFFNTLSTRIQSTPGYRDGFPVAFINAQQISSSAMRPIAGFEGMEIEPVDGVATLVNVYSWKEFMHYWCGFCPESADPAVFETMPQVEDMPHYPDDGSIRIIDNTVVVKF